MRQDQPSQTAEAVSLIRATDQQRPAAKRVLDDPYASWFLGPVALAALASRAASGGLGRYADRLSDGLISFVLTRHRYIDDCLVRFLRGRKIDQVVLLGAGYDSRAYRFARQLRNRPVFEVDHPATSRRKARIVEKHRNELPKVDVRRVEVDFQSQSFRAELRRAGFREGRPTFFIWEGVSMYLTRAAVKTTLSTLAEMGGAGSQLVMDFWYLPDQPDLRSTMRRLSANMLALLGEPVTFAIHPEDVDAFLQRLGFQRRELATAEVLEQRYLDGAQRVYPASYLVHASVRG